VSVIKNDEANWLGEAVSTRIEVAEVAYEGDEDEEFESMCEIPFF